MNSLWFLAGQRLTKIPKTKFIGLNCISESFYCKLIEHQLLMNQKWTSFGCEKFDAIKRSIVAGTSTPPSLLLLCCCSWGCPQGPLPGLSIGSDLMTFTELLHSSADPPLQGGRWEWAQSAAPVQRQLRIIFCQCLLRFFLEEFFFFFFF